MTSTYDTLVAVTQFLSSVNCWISQSLIFQVGLRLKEDDQNKDVKPTKRCNRMNLLRAAFRVNLSPYSSPLYLQLLGHYV